MRSIPRSGPRRPSRFLAFAFLPLLALLTLLLPGFAGATDVNTECASLYGSSFTPVVGMVDKSIVSLSRPAKGVRQKDPAFGSCVYRATNHSAETGTSFLRNDYSRRQAFNADNSYFLAYGYGGSWYLYNANTLQLIRKLAFHGTAEPQWDATNPKVLYFLPSGGGMTLNKLNVDTNVATVVANFSGRLPWSSTARVWTRGEGSPSANGRYWCFMAETSSSGMLGIFTYDLVNNSILGTRSMSTRPDHVSMSPSGKYCVVASTTVYSQNLSSSRLLYNGTQHNDLALGADGRDYYVYTDQASTGYVTMIDLETGARTALVPTWIGGTTTSLHISGKAFNKPGWILISTYNHSGSLKWAHERVIAVQMKANPRVVSLVHHRTYHNGYWTQPHASMSRDFSRVLYNSNWGSTSSMDVDAYMVKLAPNMLGGGTTSTQDPIATSTPSSDTTAPTVNTSLSVYSSSITMKANATDAVGVSKIEFYIDGQKKGQDYAPGWEMSMSTATWWPGSTHTYTIKAYDPAGNVRSSNGITFTAGKAGSYSSATVPSSTSTGSTGTTSSTSTGGDTTAPSISPTLSVYGGSITMGSNVSDNVGVVKVEFYIDGNKKGQAYGSPWNMNLSTATWWPGSTHTYTARAYDKAGNVRTSSGITFTTGKTATYSGSSTGTSSGADTTAPTVSAAVAVSSGSITMKATASDNVGVTKVEFYIDGVIKGYDTTSAYSLWWNTRTWWPGSTHTLVAKAYDKAGNVRSSTAVSFKI